MESNRPTQPDRPARRADGARPERRKRWRSSALLVVATALVTFAMARAHFGYVAPAVFLLWWARAERRRPDSKQCEQRYIAARTPELKGLDKTGIEAHVDRAIGEFHARADEAARQAFLISLALKQAQWIDAGATLPASVKLELLREIEAAFGCVAPGVAMPERPRAPRSAGFRCPKTASRPCQPEA